MTCNFNLQSYKIGFHKNYSTIVKSPVKFVYIKGSFIIGIAFVVLLS